MSDQNTPWHTIGTEIYDARGRLVGAVDWSAVRDERPTLVEARDTAAYIARACNAFPALLAALEEHGQHSPFCAAMVKWMDANMDGELELIDPFCSCDLSAALRLARGEPS